MRETRHGMAIGGSLFPRILPSPRKLTADEILTDEVSEGINIDVTADGKIVGIELLDASRRLAIESLLTYKIEPETIGDLGCLHGEP